MGIEKTHNFGITVATRCSSCLATSQTLGDKGDKVLYIFVSDKATAANKDVTHATDEDNTV